MHIISHFRTNSIYFSECRIHRSTQRILIYYDLWSQTDECILVSNFCIYITAHDPAYCIDFEEFRIISLFSFTELQKNNVLQRTGQNDEKYAKV